MKFKVGDRVVIVRGSDDHGIPEGTVCEVVVAWEDAEYPYELKNVLSMKRYTDNLAEDEIEFVED